MLDKYFLYQFPSQILCAFEYLSFQKLLHCYVFTILMYLLITLIVTPFLPLISIAVYISLPQKRNNFLSN